MRTIIFIVLFCVIPAINADECTEVIDAYLIDLNASLVDKHSSSKEKQVLRDKIDNVVTKRRTMSDCSIRSDILGFDDVYHDKTPRSGEARQGGT